MSYLKKLEELVSSYNEINHGKSECILNTESDILSTIKPHPAYASISIEVTNGRRFRLRRDGYDDDKKLLEQVAGH